MRITVLAVGSRGDVDPFVVLGVRLRAAGHTVRIATHDEFAAAVTGAGLEFATLPGNPREVLTSPQGQQMLAKLTPAPATAAAELGSRIAGEDGPAAAVGVLVRIAERGRA